LGVRGIKHMKIKAYDKYNKQWIYIILGNDDEMHYTEEYSSNEGVFHKQTIQFQAIEGDNDGCSPKRWSDLEKFEIIN
jgi:hypothetical protein